ncbi:hypothetical protein OIU83_03455 [Flavobacterium sp. LS1R49]|uniref:MG2 domain-containing protein n=1 Tax=Flavobacterium shii TaxID=2987687 RepID=A0A9X2ZDS8_9FLAO|nr:hypothetical protein [Flavobacterium shii]MCV9926687.1 hypothetical protein [Flavobacterium shii]
MEKLKYILLLILVINTKQTIAQQNISVDETVFIHANATTFVSGETILYKIYCVKSIDKTPSPVSKLAYVELIDASNSSIFKNKLFLENSTGEGSYFIPTTLKTGNYKLIGYTNWMLNSSTSKTFQIDIKIINPYQVSEANTFENKTITEKPNLGNLNTATLPRTEEPVLDKNFKIKLNKKTFSNREKVALEIESSATTPEKGNYSLSVRKIDNLPTINQISTNEFSKIPITIDTDLQNKEKVILPELRGEMISGKVLQKNNTGNVQNVLVALSSPGKSFALKVVKTDQTGHFVFNLDKAYYNPETIIQILGDERENYTIQLDKMNQPDYSKLSFQPDFNLPIEVKESLLERSIASQIENAYYQDKADSIIKPAKISPFYYPVAKEYVLNDFTRFPSLMETIIEVTTELYHKKEGNNYSLHVTDYKIFPQLPEPALVLVDGLLLQNINELFNYNMKNVYSISIITGRYYVGPKFFNGIISLITIENDFTSQQKENYILKATVLRPSIKKSYYKADYTDKEKYERIPDFRNQLLWNPEVTINSTENPISFFTSDIPGTYEISMEGFTEKGIPVSLKDTFKVE